MRTYILTPALLLLGACTVGPDYAGPPVVAPAPDAGDGFVRAGDLSASQPALANWWEGLDDPVLNELEQLALSGSPDLATARARLDGARANLRLDRANGMPEVGAMGVAAHLRTPDLSSDPESDGGISTTNIMNLGLSGSWEIDLFGGQRRQMEVARAKLDSAQASVADARVSLTSAVAQAYLQYRDRQQRLGLAETTVLRSQDYLELETQRFDHGVGTQTLVENAQKALEDARQQVAPLRAEADSFANALAILAGKAPGAVDAMLAEPSAIPLPPASVAVGDPAALLQRRPDIRVAERALAAETANVGVAEAARFPHLSFMGLLGIGGSNASDLTKLDDFTAIAAPMLQWNFLDFGRGKAQVGQAEAKRDEAEASYRGTVLNALGEVEDALSAYRSARENVASLARAEISTAKLEELERQRFDLGTGTKLRVIQAELAHMQAQQALTQGKVALTTQFVTLQKALGLGWSAD